MLFRPQRLPTLRTSAVFEINARISRLIRSSWSTASADCRIRRALTVSNSGSPGPAPTRKTLPFMGDPREERVRSPGALTAELRTTAGWLPSGATFAEILDRSSGQTSLSESSRVRRASPHRQALTGLRTRDATAVQGRDCVQQSRWPPASHHAEQPRDNKNHTARDRPRCCKEFGGSVLHGRPRRLLR